MKSSSIFKIMSQFFQKIASFLFRKYDLFNTWKQRFLFVFLLFFISYGFLAFFKPFGLRGMSPFLAYALMFKYTLFPLVLWLGIVGLSSVFFRKMHTVLSTLSLLFVLVIISGITSYAIWAQHFNRSGLNWIIIKNFQVMAFSTGFMPMVIILFIHSNYTLQKRLKELVVLNLRISKKKEIESGEMAVRILSKEQNKDYQFGGDKIFYLQSQDNYVKIVTYNKGVFKQDLMRTTLVSTEKEISQICPHIFRCHNSFIVNMQKVVKIEGNSAGYKLFLENGTEEIPVSRKYVPLVRNYFNK